MINWSDEGKLRELVSPSMVYTPGYAFIADWYETLAGAAKEILRLREALVHGAVSPATNGGSMTIKIPLPMPTLRASACCDNCKHFDRLSCGWGIEGFHEHVLTMDRDDIANACVDPEGYRARHHVVLSRTVQDAEQWVCDHWEKQP